MGGREIRLAAAYRASWRANNLWASGRRVTWRTRRRLRREARREIRAERRTYNSLQYASPLTGSTVYVHGPEDEETVPPKSMIAITGQEASADPMSVV